MLRRTGAAREVRRVLDQRVLGSHPHMPISTDPTKRPLRRQFVENMSTDDELARYIIDRYKKRAGALKDAVGARQALQEIRSDLQRCEAFVGPKALSSALQVAARFKNPVFAEQLLGEARDNGWSVDPGVLLALASAHASVGDVERTRDLLHEADAWEMHAAKGILLRALAKAKKTPELLDYFSTLVGEGFPYTHRHLVTVLSGHTDPEAAYTFLRNMRAHFGFAPQTMCCNAALGVCVKPANVEVAEAVLGFMSSSGLQKDESTFNTLVSVHAKAKDLPNVERVLQDYCDGRSKRITAHMCASYLRCTAYLVEDGIDVEKNVERARAMHQQAIALGYYTSLAVHTNLLEVYAAAGLFDAAEELDTMLSSMRIRPSLPFTKMLTELRALRDDAGQEVHLPSAAVFLSGVDKVRERATSRVRRQALLSNPALARRRNRIIRISRGSDADADGNGEPAEGGGAAEVREASVAELVEEGGFSTSSPARSDDVLSAKPFDASEQLWLLRRTEGRKLDEALRKERRARALGDFHKQWTFPENKTPVVWSVAEYKEKIAAQDEEAQKRRGRVPEDWKEDLRKI